MTEWTLLKRLLDAVHQHSTMMGRLWLTVMVVFRLLVVAVATEDVYTDEQQMFVCDSRRPGCCSVCYDAFAPISQPRFWVFHIISVSTPSLCFIVYTWHNLSKLGPPGRTGPDPSGPEAYDRSCDSDGHSVLGHSLTRVLGSGGPDRARASPCVDGTAEGPPGSGGVLSRCYVLHVCLRAVLEVGFVLAQWKLFGFRVPVHFLCSSAPCGQPVDCYVSRPTEKTVFLLFMFSVGVFCILLNLLELNHLGWKKIRQVVRIRESWGLRGGYETFRPGGSPSLTSSLVFRDVTSTSSLPTLDLVVGPDWICAGSRIQEAEEVRDRPDCPRGENQTLKGQRETRGPKPRSTEVWI